MKKLPLFLLTSVLPLGLGAWGTAAAARSDVPVRTAVTMDTTVVTLEAADGSTAAGTARLSAAAEGASEVTMEMLGGTPDTEFSAFLFAGTCEAPGEVKAPLGTVRVDGEGKGAGSAALTESLDVLLAPPASVQVHPAGEAPSQTLLCGNVPAAPGMGGEG